MQHQALAQEHALACFMFYVLGVLYGECWEVLDVSSCLRHQPTSHLMVLSRDPLSSKLPTASRHSTLPRWPRRTRTRARSLDLQTLTVVSPPG
jgi:hypothetical protein